MQVGDYMFIAVVVRASCVIACCDTLHGCMNAAHDVVPSNDGVCFHCCLILRDIQYFL